MRNRLSLFLAIVFLSACASTAPQPSGALNRSNIVWPNPPAETRIAFVNSVTKADDLGIHKGFITKAIDFVFGNEALRIIKPSAVVAYQEFLYVADLGNKAIHRFDTKRHRHQIIRGPQGQSLPSPVGMALGRSGEVFVTDSALAKVFVIQPDAEEAKVLSVSEPLSQPTGIAYNPYTQWLYVTETTAHRVTILQPDGTLVRRFGQRGKADSQFNYPTYLTRMDNGNIVITDALNFRLQMFDAAGRHLHTFGKQGDGTGDMARLKGVAADNFGHLYVVDAIFPAVQVFNAQGDFLLSLGALGKDPGEFWLPMGIFVDAENKIYVADTYNQRIQIMQYVGGAK